MSKQREMKEQLVQDITTKIKNSKSTFFVEYLGLTVADITKLRNELRDEGVEFKVYKNRLVKIAAKNAGYEGLDEALLGPNAVAFSSEDETSAARIISEHAKVNETLKFKAGIFEGKVINVEMVTMLSQIPPRETLLTQIAAGLLQPLTQVAIGLHMFEESHVEGIDETPKTLKVPTTEKAKEESPVEKTEVKIEEVPVEEVGTTSTK